VVGGGEGIVSTGISELLIESSRANSRVNSAGLLAGDVIGVFDVHRIVHRNIFL
jgi:hypothetical protein